MSHSDGKQSPSRWRRDAVDLQGLEDKLRIEIDPAFFEPEQDFRPFNQVIEILSVSLDQDDDGESGPEFDRLADNPLHKNIQRQLGVCSEVVEHITVEHHGSLNSSVQAMGGVARHYNQTRANVGLLRDQLRECKQLLQTGSSQTDVRELWQRKLQYSLVLRLLSALDMIKDAPAKFDRLVRQKKFVGAVDLLNDSLLNIFSPELVDVPAVASVRDEMLVQKGKILDTLVEEIADVLFLRAATRQLSMVAKARGGARSRGRRDRTSGTPARGDDLSPHFDRGPPSDAGSESSAGGGEAAEMTWAGIRVDVTDVGDEEEQLLDDPSQDSAVYLRLLVESVRRLRCVDDVERYLLERLPDEVLTLSATHMRMCIGRHEEEAAKLRGTVPDGAKNGDGTKNQAQNLTQYLRLAFDSFTCVLANLMRLIRLLHAARLRDLRESDPGAAVFEADAPYREALVVDLWQHIQIHLRDVLARHVDVQNAAKKAAGGNASKPGARQTDIEAMSVSSTIPYFRPLRRPDSSATGLTSTAVELDHASAAEYCLSRVLAQPSPLTLMSVFRPTLKFVEVGEAMLSAMRKEVFETGHIQRDRGARRASLEGNENESKTLPSFVHSTARDKVLPVLASDCQAVNSQLKGDHDAFFPTSMTSGTQATTKRASSDTLMLREYVHASPGLLRPSRSTEEIYGRALTHFRAMIQMPSYAEEVSDILRNGLEDYFTLAQSRFQNLTANSTSRSRLERFSDKLRNLLKGDAHHAAYKAVVYGGHGGVAGNDAAGLSTKSPPRSAELEQVRRRNDEQIQISAKNEADDIFESEFMMLKDLWDFDAAPPQITKQNLLSLRKQQGVACLAFSCDWLAHRLLKMCALMRQKAPLAARDAQSVAFGSKSKAPSRFSFEEGRSPLSGAPAEKLQLMAQKLSGLANDSLLCLRLEVYILVGYYMQQLPSVALDVASGQGSTTAMSLGSVEDQCVVDLNRCIREEQEALSPFEPKGNLPLLGPRELLAFVLVPLPKLLPRLFVRSLGFLKEKSITTGGVGKLNKILSTLQQTVADVADGQKSWKQGETSTDGTKSENQMHTDSVVERFGWARQYVSLVSLTQGEVEAFIRNNRTKYSREEYRVVWSLMGPNRRRADGGSSKSFDVWWASEKF